MCTRKLSRLPQTKWHHELPASRPTSLYHLNSWSTLAVQATGKTSYTCNRTLNLIFLSVILSIYYQLTSTTRQQTCKKFFNYIIFIILFLKGIETPVEKIIQSVDLFFPVRLIVSLIVYQYVNYFFGYSALHPCRAVTSSGEKCM